ncbi:hypothetical protein AB4Y77_11395 [Paenarthrobacter sp. YAF11_1]|uniref:hypothetical protein n=1 Tax=Paenarthrobacter sp. YAF11_1 TaxID=3233074 RepID=UPI003F97FDDC
MHATDQWQSLAGSIVEVREAGRLYRRGWVEHVMADASGFWLARDGVATREFIHKSMGYQVLTGFYPRPSSV